MTAWRGVVKTDITLSAGEVVDLEIDHQTGLIEIKPRVQPRPPLRWITEGRGDFTVDNFDGSGQHTVAFSPKRGDACSTCGGPMEASARLPFWDGPAVRFYCGPCAPAFLQAAEVQP